jgi:hypothetical protein
VTDQTIRVQPVEPETLSVQTVVARLVGGYAGVALLGGLFLMLAFGTLHELYPSIPAVTYWQGITLALGWAFVGGVLRPRWKWAGR